MESNVCTRNKMESSVVPYIHVGPTRFPALIPVLVEPCDVGPWCIEHVNIKGHRHVKIATKLEAGRRECVQCSFFGRLDW